MAEAAPMAESGGGGGVHGRIRRWRRQIWPDPAVWEEEQRIHGRIRQRPLPLTGREAVVRTLRRRAAASLSLSLVRARPHRRRARARSSGSGVVALSPDPAMDSEDVQAGYAAQLARSFSVLACFVLPCALAEAAYKAYWYWYCAAPAHGSGSGSAWWWAAAACAVEVASWVYRVALFFMVCVLFHIICYLQILRMVGFAREFGRFADVATVLQHHRRIREQLRKTSHRYRKFIVLNLLIITTYAVLSSQQSIGMDTIKALSSRVHGAYSNSIRMDSKTQLRLGIYTCLIMMEAWKFVEKSLGMCQMFM